MNLRQKRFVLEAVKPGQSATQAAIKAGYTPKAARRTASELVRTNPDIRVAIDSKAWDILAKAEVDVVKLVRELKKMAMGKMRDELKLKAIFALLKMAGYLDTHNQVKDDAPKEIQSEIRILVEHIHRQAPAQGSPKVIDHTD